MTYNTLSNYVNLTEDVNMQKVNSTYEKQGIAVYVTADSDLGGGELTIGVRPEGADVDFETLATEEALEAGVQTIFVIGTAMEYAVNLEGSTGAEVKVFIAPIN